MALGIEDPPSSDFGVASEDDFPRSLQGCQVPFWIASSSDMVAT